MNSVDVTLVAIGAPVASLPSHPPLGVFDVGRSLHVVRGSTPAAGGRACATYTESPSTSTPCAGREVRRRPCSTSPSR